MSEETCEYFWNQFYDGPLYDDGRNNFPEEGDGVPKISFQSLQLGRSDEDCHNDFEHFTRRISVEDFSIPKFEMRLAANQGNLKQLASILSVKRTTVKRCLRPKFEEFSAIRPENAMPVVSSVNHQDLVETKRCSFPDTLSEILNTVCQQQEQDVRF